MESNAMKMKAAGSQKRRHLCTRLHGVASKKTTILIVTAVQTPNLTIFTDEKYISIMQQK
jgi:hypothetical protein